MKKIDPRSLRPYAPARWTLIPLHKYTDTATDKRGRVRLIGKAPLDKAWPTKAYNSRAVIARCVEENRNTGVALKADQLVIDVDPRHGGDKGFANLCLDLGIDPETFPRVITGSGGDHYYMSKPADILVLDTIEGYEGVEFKSKGRQMVAPGSIHPDTEDYYVWADGHPDLEDMPEAPRALLKIIQRPQRSAVTGGGQYTQEKIAHALEALDPCDFAQHDKWFRIMCACHHASNGDARSEFIDWSTSDPEYADQAEIIGRRWDSLHKDKDHGITYATLNKFLADGNAANRQVPGNAKGDFDAVDDQADTEMPDDPSEASWLEGEEDADPDAEAQELSALEKLNKKYVSVVEGGKFRIVYKVRDPVLERDYWVRMSAPDFVMMHSNHKLERAETGKGKPSTIGLGTAWLQWANRNHVQSIMFDPSGKDHPGHWNLWDGFATAPSGVGEWSLLRELIFEVLSDGNEEIDTYIMNWLAYMFQFPERRAEVALVFRGGMGIGKGTLGNVISKLIGRHAIAIASPELLTGRFNAHLHDLIFLFADEAVKPYDRQAESRLKALITEPMISYEGKGRDAITAKNYIHIMMASNEQWVIPAGIDERRYLVSDANKKWQGKESKWVALHKQMNNGGFGRMLFDLTKQTLPDGWSPRLVPKTVALVDQKIRSLSPLSQYFFDFVFQGVLPFAFKAGPWEQHAIRFFMEDLRTDFQSWCNNNRINPGGMGRASTRFLMQEMQQIFPNARTGLREPVEDEDFVKAQPSDGRALAFEIPSLPDCRIAYEKQLNGPVEWNGPESDFG